MNKEMVESKQSLIDLSPILIRKKPAQDARAFFIFPKEGKGVYSFS
jgi:hypothetical protein